MPDEYRSYADAYSSDGADVEAAGRHAQEAYIHMSILPSSAVTRAHCGFGGFDRTARSGTPGSFPPPGIIRTLVQGKRFKLRLAVAGVPMGVPFREFINAEPTGKRLATGRLMTGRLWTTH